LVNVHIYHHIKLSSATPKAQFARLIVALVGVQKKILIAKTTMQERCVLEEKTLRDFVIQ